MTQDEFDKLIGELVDSQALPLPCWPRQGWRDYGALAGRHPLALRALTHLRAHGAWRGLVKDETSSLEEYFDARRLKRFAGEHALSTARTMEAIRDLLARATTGVAAARAHRLAERAGIVVRRLGCSDSESLPPAAQGDKVARLPSAIGAPNALPAPRVAASRIVRLSRAEPAINQKAYLPVWRHASDALASHAQTADATQRATLLARLFEAVCQRDEEIAADFGEDAQQWSDEIQQAIEIKRGVPATQRYHAPLPDAGTAPSAGFSPEQLRLLDDDAVLDARLAHYFLRVLHAELQIACPKKAGTAVEVFYIPVLALVDALEPHRGLGEVATRLAGVLPDFWLFGGARQPDSWKMDLFDPFSFECRASEFLMGLQLDPIRRGLFEAAAGVARAVAAALADPLFLSAQSGLSTGRRRKMFSYLAAKLRFQSRTDKRASEWCQLKGLFGLYARPGYVERAHEIQEEWLDIGGLVPS